MRHDRHASLARAFDASAELGSPEPLSSPEPSPSSGPSALRVAVETSRGALDALVPAWAQLYERCPDARVFLRPEWLLPWLDHLAQGEPLFVTVFSGDVLVGLLPLVAWPDECGMYAFAGTGVSDTLDMLVDPAHGMAPALAAVERLRREHRFTSLELHELTEASPLLAAAREGRLGPIAAEGPLSSCCLVPIPNQGAGFGDILEPSFAKRVEADIRKAERERLRFSFDENEAELLPALDALLRLHQDRWRYRGGGVWGDGARVAFLREASSRLAAQRLARIAAVRRDGELAAGILLFTEHARWMGYACGFDRRFAKLSPGIVVLGHTVREAAKSGARELDMLRGEEDYKMRWMQTQRVQYRLRLV